ncbi:MAG: polyferredoxin [Bacteriovoracaceae bacterium]|jgi:ferredoxin-type protein NapH
MKRSPFEKAFIALVFPVIIAFYFIYKYPTWFVSEDQVVSTFYWFGKSTGFWYATIYSGLVCSIAFKVFMSGKTPYGKNKKKPISKYQRNKFISIFLSQLILFYLVPYIFPYFIQGGEFFNDQYKPVNKNAYVYIYNGFTSIGGFVYLFVLVPLVVWFVGKRYCSWFCACGNLSETIGVTELGNKWVTMMTPRGETSRKLESIQYVFLAFGIVFGILLFLDAWNIFASGELLQSMRGAQDLVVDFIFGALIGVGAYPFLGTRIWCRYGCPLAASMRLFGKFTKSKFKVAASDKCKGLDLCTTQCPMGIDVASYAHKDGVPIKGSFSLETTPCIGCGGCIDICPVKALTFEQVLGGK